MTTDFLNIYELITSKEQDSDLSFILLNYLFAFGLTLIGTLGPNQQQFQRF